MDGLQTIKRFPKSIIIAVFGLILGGWYILGNTTPDPVYEPVRQPASKPFKHSIAGTGIVEALDENIRVAPHFSGRVTQVLVKEGDFVTVGEPLFTLDTQELEKQILQLKARRDSQAIALERTRHEPRDVDLPPLKATWERAQYREADALSRLEKLKAVDDPRAVSADELNQAEFTWKSAQAETAQAKAEYEKHKAGAWTFDVNRARAELSATDASLQEAQTRMRLTTVTAPVAGEVLQVNIRPGESVGHSPPADAPPVLLGNTTMLQVRVDIDEINASWVEPDMEGLAYLKGNSRRQFPLLFDHIQPYMVPKKNLTGRSDERVDVRVLQIIYRFHKPKFPVFVGQQVDVFLEKPQWAVEEEQALLDVKLKEQGINDDESTGG